MSLKNSKSVGKIIMVIIDKTLIETIDLALVANGEYMKRCVYLPQI